MGVQEQLSEVQGLFYLDGMPIRIKIAEGKIKEIVRVKSEEALDSTYVAPGLIDNQVNGYASVGFSSPDLTVEGIRRATKALWKAGVTSLFAHSNNQQPRKIA